MPKIKTTTINLDAPPSEILSQMLFVSYVQRIAKSLSKRIVLFAPTQPEEERLGYDARLIDGGCRELYLQFKRGEQSPDQQIRFKVDNSSSKKTGAKQLDTLKRDYPPLSAFYVTGGFWNVRCTLEAQRLVTWDESFLDLYAAVSAHAINLPSGQKSSQVCLGGRCYPPYTIFWKDYNPYMIKSVSARMTHGQEWFYGSDLFRDFLSGRVGCSIQVQLGGQVVRTSNFWARELSLPGYNTEIPIQPGTDTDFSENRLTVRVFDD